jgi:hypothetical protein
MRGPLSASPELALLWTVALLAMACSDRTQRAERSLGRMRPIVVSPADESSPSTNGTDVAWTRGRINGPVIAMKLGSVFVRYGSAKPVQITPHGALAASGGMDAETLVVQVVRNNQSDLLLFDLRTRRFRGPPRGVNTRAWEWHGSISGPWLLYGRYNGVNRHEIVLANIRTHRQRILDTVEGHGAYAEPGQVNGQYAVWAGCPDNFCSVYRYAIGTRKLVRVPGDYKHAQFRSAVSPDGDVYYGRSLWSCGGHVQLMAFRKGKRPRLVAELPRRYDFRFLNFGAGHLLFDSGRCPAGNPDIYSIKVAG